SVENEERELKSEVILARHRGGGMLPRELEPTMQTAGVLLVAVERGAVLPSWIGHCQDKVSDVFMLIENNEEPRDALLRRVDQRLALLSDAEHRLGLMVLVAAPGNADEETESARVAVAERLLSYLSQLGEGTLLMLTDERAALDSRVQLLSMAGVLAQQLRGTKLSVSVRFGAQAFNEPPKEVFELAEPPRRGSRRPPLKSGQMPKASLIPPIHKALPLLTPRRRFGTAG
ncbi:MAG TPA: hypothetical protein VIV60_07520, partial [Polyangiaceae bacterium]